MLGVSVSHDLLEMFYTEYIYVKTVSGAETGEILWCWMVFFCWMKNVNTIYTVHAVLVNLLSGKITENEYDC
jgi:hypothetical protein